MSLVSEKCSVYDYSLIMKEQWSISENNIQLTSMEEGLCRGNKKYIKKIETNCCMSYLRLIFLLEITLFFGWGCYMIYMQTYRPGEIKNKSTNITLERYPPMIESLSDIPKSRQNTEMPVIFVKPKIIDKINNLLEDMKFTKDQNLIQNKPSITNVPSMMQINTQNSNNLRRNNNIIRISAVNRLFATSLSENLMHNKKFTKNPVLQLFLVKYIDKNMIDDMTDKNEKYARSAQFLEKLKNVSKTKAINDLEEFESRNDDFTEDVNRSTLESQENHALDVSNRFENLDLNVARISNPENFVDHTIADLTNILQDPKQEFSDLVKNAAQDDHDENNSSFDKTDDQVNARLELDLVVCPPYESHEFSDMLIKDSTKDSFTSQSLLAQEISEQIENGSSGRNENKHDINDSDMSMSASATGNKDHFDMSTVTVQNIEEQYSPENIAKLKEDEKYESMENIENFYKSDFLLPTVQDSTESSMPNVDKFEWFNGPPSFVDLGLGDISKSSKIHDSLLWDTYKDVDDVIPGSQCEITINMGILKVKCPAIKFDEEWNFTSSKVPVTDVPKVTNFRDIFDIFDIYLHTECEEANKKLEVENIFTENSDKQVTTSRDSIIQESTTSAKISNDALLDLSDTTPIEPFDNEKINQDYAFYDSTFYGTNEEEKEIKQVTTESSSFGSEFGFSNIDSNKEQNPFLDNISGTQQKEQLKISKEQDYLVSDNIETSSNDFEHFYALEKELISLFKTEMSNIIMRYLSKSSYENNYQNNICSIFRYMHSISQHPWREQYVALRKFLEYIQDPNYPHSMDYRKKRMTDDLTGQDQISNTLEEDEEDVDLLENLRKIFQKMEILALSIDRLHERHLLHNKLDDGYVSSEFPIETEELYTSRDILYEK